MPFNSPLANPAQYITKINNFSNEGIAIDKRVDSARRDAAEFAAKYAADFQIVSELKASTEHFSGRWVTVLQQSRDAASSISAWYQRFDQVFLSLIYDIKSEQDAKDVIAEFNSLLGEEHPSNKYQLGGVPGVKGIFAEIEGFVVDGSTHVIKVLQDTKDWKKAVEELKHDIPAVQNGAKHVRNALNNYATKLD